MHLMATESRLWMPNSSELRDVSPAAKMNIVLQLLLQSFNLEESFTVQQAEALFCFDSIQWCWLWGFTSLTGATVKKAGCAVWTYLTAFQECGQDVESMEWGCSKQAGFSVASLPIKSQSLAATWSHFADVAQGKCRFFPLLDSTILCYYEVKLFSYMVSHMMRRNTLTVFCFVMACGPLSVL